MKKIFNLTSLIVISFVLIFTSCKKEEPLRPNNDQDVYVNNASVEGVNWVLVSGRIYIENIDNGDKFVYDHFGGSTTESVMDIFSGSSPVKMDSIKQNYTTWFFNNGIFTLNGTYSYQYSDYQYTYSPYGLENGSSRPIEITRVTDEVLTVMVHEGFGSDGVNNFNYVNQLTFVKAGLTCNSCEPSTNYGYVYSGVWSTPSVSNETLEGTKWVVTRYLNSFGNVYPNDTLDFISQTKYTINSGSQKSYSLSGVAGNNMRSLSLYSFTTLGGDYSGQVIGSFITDGVINNSQFSDMFNVNNTVTVWMERIP